MKKNILLLMTFCLCMVAFSSKTMAQTWDCGAQGNNVTATLSSGTLTISGSGAMADWDFEDSDYVPWFEYKNSINTVIIQAGVTNIGSGTFYSHRSLTFITIPNSVTSIRYGAFYACYELISIILPANVISIGEYAFCGCNALNSITNLNPIPFGINSNVFCELDKTTCVLQVPTNSVTAYQGVEVWKEFNIIGIEVGIGTIETSTVKIYPNPTTRELRVESGEWRIEDVAIYDVFGKMQKIAKSGNTIDISHFAAGVYFLKISTEAGEEVRKVMKE